MSHRSESKLAPHHGVDDVLPIRAMLPLAVQHVLVMYTGAITVPLLIGQALGLSAAQVATLIQADLFTSGMATVLQTIGLWGIGARLPLMQGVSFAAVSSVVAIASSHPNTSTGGSEGLRIVFGAVIVAGITAMFAAPLGRYVMKLFPPVVIGTSLSIMGLSLMPVAINYISSDGTISVRDVVISMSVLAISVICSVFGRGFVKNLAVILGIFFGLAIVMCTADHPLHAHLVQPLFKPVVPFPVGWPIFRLVPSLSMIVIVAITWVESIGDAIVVGEITCRPATPSLIKRLLLADGLATMLGGVLGSFPYTAFSENVALLGMTGVRSRWVVAMAGCLLLILGMSPFLAALVASIPPAVAGGAGLIIFSTLIMVGIQILGKSECIPGSNSFITSSVSICISMIIIMKPGFFGFMPDWCQPVMQSPVVMGSLTAVFLNIGLEASKRFQKG